MKSLGKKPAGARFGNVHPAIAGLRDPNASMPTLSEFLCGGDRRVPRGPLPSDTPEVATLPTAMPWPID